MILDLLPIRDAVYADATPHALTSKMHGPKHWNRVAKNAIRLSASHPVADLNVALHFALIHDAFRFDDWRDPDHGRRACAWAIEHAEIFPEGFPLGVLAHALMEHAEGYTTQRLTEGICWDADRLDLGRVGTVPNPALMSTAAGMRAAEAIRARL